MHSVAALGAHRHAARTKHLAAAAVAPAGGDTGARAPSCPRPCRSRTRASLPALHVAFRANAPRRSSATTAASRICRARVVTRPRAGTAPSARTGGSHTCAPSTALTPGANAPVYYRMLRLFKSCSRCAHAQAPGGGAAWHGLASPRARPLQDADAPGAITQPPAHARAVLTPAHPCANSNVPAARRIRQSRQHHLCRVPMATMAPHSAHHAAAACPVRNDATVANSSCAVPKQHAPT